MTIPRIAAAEAPYTPEIEVALTRIMPMGVPPLILFTTLARNPRVFQRFMAGGLLDKGSISLREREIVVNRATARCGSEYEWGVHIAFFAEASGLTPQQIHSTVHGGPRDCIFATYQECKTSIAAVYAECYRNPRGANARMMKDQDRR